MPLLYFHMGRNGNKSIGKLNLIAAILLIAIVAARLLFVQFSDSITHKHYSDPVISSSLIRGTIYDRNGNILAIQAPDYGFRLNLIDAAPSFVASVISPHTASSALQVTNGIVLGETFFTLKEVPDSTKIAYLERLLVNFALDDQITIERIEERKYPSGRYTEDIVGKVDHYMEGISGIEKLLNNSLKATPKIGLSHIQGSNAVLTIDQSLQFAINSIGLLGKDGIEAAIMNKNGELLAFSGVVTDEILNNAVISTSSADSYLSFNPTFPNESFQNESKAIGTDSTYYIWAKSENDMEKELILQLLEDILVQQGRI